MDSDEENAASLQADLVYPQVVNGEPEMMGQVVEMLCDWLNQFVGPDEENMRIYPADFGTEKVQINGQEHGGYGFVSIVHRAKIERWDQEVWFVEAGTGDEGGPSLLTVWWEHETEAIYEPPFDEVELRSEGDTYEERAATQRWVWKSSGETASAPEYIRSEHLGWSLAGMVQEFDTYRSLIVDRGQIVQDLREEVG